MIFCCILKTGGAVVTSAPTTRPPTTVRPTTSYPAGIDNRPTQPTPIQRPPDVVLPPAEQGNSSSIFVISYTKLSS